MGILMIRARKPGVPFLPADTSKLLLSALAQCFLGRPTVHTAMHRMNGLLETHGSASLMKMSTDGSISTRPHDIRLSLTIRHTVSR